MSRFASHPAVLHLLALAEKGPRIPPSPESFPLPFSVPVCKHNESEHPVPLADSVLNCPATAPRGQAESQLEAGVASKSIIIVVVIMASRCLSG